MTFGFYARRGVYSSPWAKEQIRKMKQLNVEYVALIATVFREACGSTREYLDLAESPGELELARMIDFIHAEGLKVMLRPMLETHDGNGRLQVWFPDDRERIPGKSSPVRPAANCTASTVNSTAPSGKTASGKRSSPSPESVSPDRSRAATLIF